MSPKNITQYKSTHNKPKQRQTDNCSKFLFNGKLFSAILLYLILVQAGIVSSGIVRNQMAKNELVSLALLYISPMHAYAINTVLEQMSVEHWAQVSRASIYAALNRLEKRGAINVRLEKVDNMPERKVFSITTEGETLLRQELKDAISTCNKSDSNIFHLAVNLFFGVTPEEGIVWANERLSSITVVEKHILSEIAEMEKKGCLTALMTLRAAQRHTEVEKDCVKEFIKLLEENPEYYNHYLDIFRSKILNEDSEKRCK